MCVSKVALLTVVLAGMLVGAPTARADVPPPSDPACVLRHCSCDASGVLRECDFDCAALCSNDSSGGPTTGSTTTQGTPPIVKAAALLVLGAAFLSALAVAPGFTISQISNRQSAADASRNWDAFVDERNALDREGPGLDRRARDLEAYVSRAAAPPAQRVDATYKPVAASAQVDRWAPGGYCTKVDEANARFLRDADREATELGWKFVPLPPRPRDAARGAVRAAVLARYDAMKDYYDFMATMLNCTLLKPDTEAMACLNALIETTAAGELKNWIARQIGPGIAQTIDRARKGAELYRGYVERLRREVEIQTITAMGC